VKRLVGRGFSRDISTEKTRFPFGGIFAEPYSLGTDLQSPLAAQHFENDAARSNL
jgi:hypothetical protein